MMGAGPSKTRRILRITIMIVATILVASGAYFYQSLPPEWNPLIKASSPPPTEKPSLSVELVEGSQNTLFVPEIVRSTLGMDPVVSARSPEKGRDMMLPGSLALDPNRIWHMRAQFSARVMELKTVSDSGTGKREIHTCDKVKEGEVLAVLWSADVGSKKSDLADALVQLRLDKKRLEVRKELWQRGSIPEDTYRQTERDVMADQNAADRAERTLRTWNIPDNEIDAVKQESADRLIRGERDPEKERLWARSELKAPMSGTIVERNIGVREYISDTTMNLFTISDVSRLLVLAYPSEEQLKQLMDLKPDERKWTLTTNNASTLVAPIDEISHILDPNMHTGVAKGYIDNSEEKLRAGQLAGASIRMRPPTNVVEVELTALIEDGKFSYVFIQADAEKQLYTMRRILVKQRFDRTAYVWSELTSEQCKLSPEEEKLKIPPPQPLVVGDRYITSGALELRAALDERLAKARAAK